MLFGLPLSAGQGRDEVFLKNCTPFRHNRLTHLTAISYFWQRIPFRLFVSFRFVFFIAILLLTAAENNFAQVTGPEQDCDDAIAVCQTLYVQNQSYQGIGQVDDLIGTVSCLDNNENNSVWYIFTVTISGLLELTITPQAGDDYDFALYNLTNGSCADIFNGVDSIEVRCNYAFTNGATGLLDGYTTTSQGPGGLAFLAPLNVTVGETYALLVDNFSSTSSGYTLDFAPTSSTTASIIDFIPPSITQVDSLNCDNTTTFNITFSEPILCSSLAADGSDFQITGNQPVTIISATSPDCAGGSFTLNALITVSAPITIGGNYSLHLQQGSDGNTVEDNCGNDADTATLPLFVPGIVNAGFTFTKSSSCVADTFRFANTSTGNVTSVFWDFGDGDTSVLNNPMHVYTVIDTYTVTLIVSSPECSDTLVNNSIIVTNSFIASFIYNPSEPCATQPVTFTDSSQTAATAYFWNIGSDIYATQNVTHVFPAGGFYDVYFVIQEQTLGCEDTAELTIFVHDNVIAAFDADSPACADVVVNFTDISAGTPASWLWTFPGNSTSTTQNPVFTFSASGAFPVQLAVVDSFCGTDTIIQSIDVLPLPIFYLGNDTFLCRSEEVTLTAYPGADSYLWSTGQTTATIVFDSVPGTVWATATVDGCPYTDTLIVNEQTLDCSFAMVPSGFSPNGDSKNDFLNVLTKRVSEYELIIFNRWGQEVYRGTSNDFGWDGYFKDEPQDLGVFGYVLKWTNLNGQSFVENGSITLVR